MAELEGQPDVFVGTSSGPPPLGHVLVGLTGDRSGLRCIGQSRVVVEPDAGLFTSICEGRQGVIELKCDHGKRIYAVWTADSCGLGHGLGYDHRGQQFNLAFGAEENETKAVLASHGKAFNGTP